MKIGKLRSEVAGLKVAVASANENYYDLVNKKRKWYQW